MYSFGVFLLFELATKHLYFKTFFMLDQNRTKSVYGIFEKKPRTCIPMQESAPSEHSRELFSHAFERFLHRCVITDKYG